MPTAVLLAALALAACSRPEAPPPTADQLRTAIEDYRQNKPEATEERITTLFARLDADIATKRADATAASPAAREPLTEQVAALERDRRDLQQAWLTARLTRVGATAGDALRSLGESLGRGLEDAGRRLRESAAGDVPPATGPAR